MPNRTPARIGLALVVAGAAVFAASWYDRTRSGPNFGPQSVRADSAAAPAATAIDEDERWQVGAACLRPYFAVAAEQAHAALKAYDDAGPEEIRAWRDRPQQDDARALHAKYPDWFEAKSRLGRQAAQWQRRLDELAGRTVTLSEARMRVRDVRLYVSEDPELAGAGRDFQHFMYFLLGLGGFPDEQMDAIRAACIDVTAIGPGADNPNAAAASRNGRPNAR